MKKTAAILVALLFFGWPSSAQVIQFSGVAAHVYPAIYTGSPNVTIEGINTSGGIYCSRDSGQTPAFFMCSASAITVTGTSATGRAVVPYEDLEFNWDWGDPTGVEIFTRPTDGVSVNANNAQRVPEAAYVYRNPGTYNVTLWIRGKNGSSYTTASVQKTLTVTQFNASGGTYYIDSSRSDDTGDGLTPATAKKTITALNALVAHNSNRQFCLAPNSHWTDQRMDVVSNFNPQSGLRFGMYGKNGCDGSSSGAKPKVEIATIASNALFMVNGAGAAPLSKLDVVFSDIEFRSSQTAGSSTILGVGCGSSNDGHYTNIYYDNLEVVSTGTAGGGINMNCALNYEIATGNQVGVASQTKFGLWNVNITTPTTGGPTVVNMAVLVSSYNITVDGFFFIFGGTITGGGTSGTFDHHIYPKILTHALYNWISFVGGDLRGNAINVDWDNYNNAFNYPKYHVISENNVDGNGQLRHFIDMGPGSGCTPCNKQDVLFSNVVVFGNNVYDMNTAEGGGLYFNNTSTITVKFNNAWGAQEAWFNPAQAFGVMNFANMSARLYFNNIYKNSTNTQSIGNIQYGGDGTTAGQVWVQQQEITDNVIWDARTSVRAIQLPVANMQSSASLIDRNQYWYPDDSDGTAFRNGSTATTVNFATWQGYGFDAAGCNQSPNWTDPANGNFTPTSPNPC